MKRTTFKHKKRTAARDETYTEQICNIKQKEKTNKKNQEEANDLISCHTKKKTRYVYCHVTMAHVKLLCFGECEV